METRHHPPDLNVQERPSVLVLGHRFAAVTGEILLRCLERGAGRPIAEGNYCWTGECGHCEVRVSSPCGPTTAMACVLLVRDGLEVVALSRYLERDLAR